MAQELELPPSIRNVANLFFGSSSKPDAQVQNLDGSQRYHCVTMCVIG